jgi:hypothetical protein
MTDIVEKLSFWQTVYPEDMEKPEGNLYSEAQKEILYLRSVIQAHHNYPTLYSHCIKYLKSKKTKRGRI